MRGCSKCSESWLLLFHRREYVAIFNFSIIIFRYAEAKEFGEKVNKLRLYVSKWF